MTARTSTIMGYTLKREIDTTCSAITGARCRVVFKGRDAYTNGHDIVLPAVDDATLYEVALANVMRGYGNHEGAHHLYTPMQLLEELRNGTAGMNLRDPAVQEALKKSPPTKIWLTRLQETFNLWNASEDWRIEHHLMQAWPGTRINLDQTRAHINEREHAMMRDEPARLQNPFNTASAILTWLNAVTNEYRCAGLAQQTLDLAQSANPSLHALVTGYWPRIIATRDLDNTSANRAIYETAQELCDRLIAVYLQDQPPPELGQNPGQKGASSAKSTANDPGTGQGEGEGSGDEPEQTPSDEPGSNGKPDQSADPGPDASAGPPAEPTTGDEPDPRAAPDPEAGSQPDGPDTQDGGSGPDGSDPAEAGEGPVSDDAPQADQGQRPEDAADGTETDADRAEREADAQRKLAAARAAARAHTPEIRDQLDIGDVIEAIGRIADAIEADGGYIGDRPAAEALHRVVRRPEQPDLRPYRKTQVEISGVTSALAGAMRSLVIAKNKRRTNYNREDGDLDMRNIVGIALGAPDVYSRTTVHRDQNTALLFLVDISASMRMGNGKRKKRPIELAMESVVALTEALGAARRVVTRYDAFTSEGERNRLQNLKDFHENVVTAKTNVSHLIRDLDLKQVVMGGTPTGEMMLEGWEVLRRRKEAKRVIMVITDGEPDDEGLANRAAASIKADGGIVIGIAVNAAEPKFDLDHWVLVPEIEELPVRIMGAIRPLIGSVM